MRTLPEIDPFERFAFEKKKTSNEILSTPANKNYKRRNGGINSYASLALFYHNIRQDYNKAEMFYEKSLNIRRKVYGIEHPDTATSYNNLALFYHNISDFLLNLKKNILMKKQ